MTKVTRYQSWEKRTMMTSASFIIVVSKVAKENTHTWRWIMLVVLVWKWWEWKKNHHDEHGACPYGFRCCNIRKKTKMMKVVCCPSFESTCIEKKPKWWIEACRLSSKACTMQKKPWWRGSTSLLWFQRVQQKQIKMTSYADCFGFENKWNEKKTMTTSYSLSSWF